MATDGPDALVMCGGRGERLRASADAAVAEKPLLPVAGRPMVDRVIDALAGPPPVGSVHAAVSPHAPDTRDHLRERETRDGDIAVVETAGEGYVADLAAALDDPRVTRPVVTAVADLPLLAPDAVGAALARSEDGAHDLTVCVPVALKEALGVSVDRTHDPAAPTDATGPAAGRALAPTGLNVVAAPGDGTTGDERVHAGWDARLAVNVNYAADAAVADRLATDAGAERTGDGGDEGGSR
ncbi:MAG: NTP transferase domain-containing protein [Haloarculaceae archaeon]